MCRRAASVTAIPAVAAWSGLVQVTGRRKGTPVARGASLPLPQHLHARQAPSPRPLEAHPAATVAARRRAEVEATRIADGGHTAGATHAAVRLTCRKWTGPWTQVLRLSKALRRWRTCRCAQSHSLACGRGLVVATALSGGPPYATAGSSPIAPSRAARATASQAQPASWKVKAMARAGAATALSCAANARTERASVPAQRQLARLCPRAICHRDTARAASITMGAAMHGATVDCTAGHSAARRPCVHSGCGSVAALSTTTTVRIPTPPAGLQAAARTGATAA